LGICCVLLKLKNGLMMEFFRENLTIYLGGKMADKNDDMALRWKGVPPQRLIMRKSSFVETGSSVKEFVYIDGLLDDTQTRIVSEVVFSIDDKLDNKEEP